MNFWQPPQMNRRNFLTTLALGAAGAPLAAGAAEEQKAFRFIAANDLHYDKGPCREWFTAMVTQMKESAPDAAFCVLCGDIANTGQKDALESVKEIFGGLGVPVHPVPGNHDYTDEDESRANYDAVFPGKLNYGFEHGGWQFLALDTTMGTKYQNTTVGEATLAWLDAELPKLDAAKPTVAFTHFPLGQKVTYTPLNAPAVVERLLKVNLRGVLSGHWHGASEVPAGKGLMTTNRCCARVRFNADKSPLKGWFVCEARGDGTLERRFVEFRAPEGIPQPDAAAKFK
jgi:3',5'-cyclic AMP phosphodiesterase CpdA